MYKPRKINLELTVFNNYQSMIVNRILSDLNKLMETVRLDVVYDSSFRNTFYCKRSGILMYKQYLPKDPILKKLLTKYHIHYVESSGYETSKNAFVKQIAGYSSFKIYKEMPRYTRHCLSDLAKQLNVNDKEISFCSS